MFSGPAAIRDLATRMHGGAVRDPSQPALDCQGQRSGVECAQALDGLALDGGVGEHEDQSSVTTVPAVSRGVTPLPQTMDGEIAPL